MQPWQESYHASINMNKPVVRFRFLGGSTREECTSRSWEENCPEADFVGYYPEIFPRGHGAPEDTDIAVVDVPISDNVADRAFCVYFRIRISRRFWNVLCFAYSTAEWTLQDRLACLRLTPDQWYNVARGMSATDVQLNLPAPPSDALPVQWDGTGIFSQNFPLRDGKLRACGTRGNWRDLLELHMDESNVPPPETSGEGVLQRKIAIGMKRIKETWPFSAVAALVISNLAFILFFLSSQSENTRLQDANAKLQQDNASLQKIIAQLRHELQLSEAPRALP